MEEITIVVLLMHWHWNLRFWRILQEIFQLYKAHHISRKATTGAQKRVVIRLGSILTFLIRRWWTSFNRFLLLDLAFNNNQTYLIQLNNKICLMTSTKVQRINKWREQLFQFHPNIRVKLMAHTTNPLHLKSNLKIKCQIKELLFRMIMISKLHKKMKRCKV